MLFKLAWRNLWRNRRRTLITTASVFFAVLLAVWMNSLQKGIWEKMIDNITGYYIGYIQLQGAGYWDEQTLENTFVLTDSLEDRLMAYDQVNELIPRLESFSLAATGDATKGVMVVGIDPHRENAFSALKSRVEQGQYLEPQSKACLLASGLAEYLGLGLNDTLIILGQGYRGSIAAGKYPVAGIVEFGSPDLNKRLVYLPLREAQWLYNTGDRLTSAVVDIRSPAYYKRTLEELRAFEDDEYELLGWNEMMPELEQSYKVDSIGNYIVLAILYIVISFGILGTLLMMISERSYEFGVLISVGMHRQRLAAVVILENVMIALMGTITGVLAGLGLVYYFYLNPIQFSGKLAEAYESYGFEPVFAFAMHPRIFISQALVVLGIALLLSLYPLWRLSRMKPVEAMRK